MSIKITHHYPASSGFSSMRTTFINEPIFGRGKIQRFFLWPATWDFPWWSRPPKNLPITPERCITAVAFVATGSILKSALQAAKILAQRGIETAVYSRPILSKDTPEQFEILWRHKKTNSIGVPLAVFRIMHLSENWIS